MTESNSEPKLIAYRLPDVSKYYTLRPASPDRYWMDVSTGGWANRCLPLRIANQNGWEIRKHHVNTVQTKINVLEG